METVVGYKSFYRDTDRGMISFQVKIIFGKKGIHRCRPF